MSLKLAKKQFIMPKLPPDITMRRQKTQKQMKSTKNNNTQTSTSLLKKSDANKSKKNNKQVSKEVLYLKLAEEKEYYPNKLKRKMTAKKIVLKPKHNTKVVAGTNKRKRGTPKKGIPSIENSEEVRPNPNDSELSMCDAVRLVDETRSLTDEDLMEILTCPSPVWWEDPPNGEYFEDAIFRLPDEKTSKNKRVDSQSHTQTSSDSRHTTTSRDIPPHTESSPDSHVDFEQEISHFKIKTDKFIQKKKKLENLLNNIVKNNRSVKRRLSESTEGEDVFSDLSLNEDILEHLENLDIPIEGSRSVENETAEMNAELSRNTNETVDTNLDNKCSGEPARHEQSENIKEEYARVEKNYLKSSGNDQKSSVVVKKPNTTIKGCKNEQNLIRVVGKKSLLNKDNIKKVIQICTDSIIEQNGSKSKGRNKQKELAGFIKVRSDLIKSDFDVTVPKILPPLKRKPVPNDTSIIDIDSISDANITFISDDDIIDEILTNKNDLQVNLNEIAGKNELPKKLINELTEYITVYKIMSNDEKKKLNDTEITKIDNAGLNNFFKKCKGSKRLKKEIITVDGGDVEKGGNSDANSVDENNRLKGCDYCVVKAEKGDTEFSCDKCNMAPVFSCDLCSFRSSAKDVIINHVSRCTKYNRTVVMC